MKHLRNIVLKEADWTGSTPSASGTAAAQTPTTNTVGTETPHGMVSSNHPSPATGTLNEDDLDIDHPVYNSDTKYPKYTARVSPLTAHYSDAGKILKSRLPDHKKDDHLSMGDVHSMKAHSMRAAHGVVVKNALNDLDRRHVEHGPLVSAIVSSNFPEDTKTTLRHLAHTGSKHASAAMAHYAAGGLRHETALTRYRSLKEDMMNDSFPLNDTGLGGPFL